MRRRTVHGAHLALRHVQRQLTRVDRTTHEHPLRSPTQPICAATLEIAAYRETYLPRGGTPTRRPALQKRPLRRTAAAAGRCGSAATRDRLVAPLLGFVHGERGNSAARCARYFSNAGVAGRMHTSVAMSLNASVTGCWRQTQLSGRARRTFLTARTCPENLPRRAVRSSIPCAFLMRGMGIPHTCWRAARALQLIDHPLGRAGRGTRPWRRRAVDAEPQAEERITSRLITRASTCACT